MKIGVANRKVAAACDGRPLILKTLRDAQQQTVSCRCKVKGFHGGHVGGTCT